MDAIDRKILHILQHHGRESATNIAAQVGLSLSACHHRIKELERSGVIRGYEAVVDPKAVGLDFEAFVFVTIGKTDIETIEGFEEAVSKQPNIVEINRLFGQPDYTLRVFAKDMADFQRLYDTILSGLPGVQRLTSTMVMKRIGAGKAMPLKG